jgi:aldose 1-epimerase
MYTITQSTENNINYLILNNEETGEYVSLLPGLGAAVHQLALAEDGICREILAPEQPELLQANPKFRGRILFPFNDRIRDASYRYRGTTYRLKANCDEDGSAIHGLIYDKPFELLRTEEEERHAAAVLRYSIKKNQFPGYPFAVNLTLTYRLEPSCFNLHFRIVNKDDCLIPLTFGWHPYFTFGAGIESAELQCPGSRYVAVDDDLYPTGSFPRTSGSQYDFNTFRRLKDTELDTGITALRSGTTVLRQGDQHITIEQDTAQFPFVWLYTPEDRLSAAVEPVSGGTDAFNCEGLGRRDLVPGEVISAWISVRIS